MDILAPDRKIAFDFDGTLVDGVASDIIAAYINDNPEKIYYIVTFRTPDLVGTIPEELQAVGLSRGQFADVLPMPKRIAFDFEEDQQFRRSARLPDMNNVKIDALLPGEYKFVHWKGFAAKKMGATVLIDDMPELAMPGCKKFGVKFVDVKAL